MLRETVLDTNSRPVAGPDPVTSNLAHALRFPQRLSADHFAFELDENQSSFGDFADARAEYHRGKARHRRDIGAQPRSPW
jgi:hypothetical protein